MSGLFSGNYRAGWHDYRTRCIYHLTLMKHPDCPVFGMLAGDCLIAPGERGSSYIHSSPVGAAIKEGLRNLKSIHPHLHLLQYAIMPDHLHLLLSVENNLDEILGRKIARLKVMINNLARVEKVFQSSFNDQIITSDRSLDAVFEYLRKNPYRLALRQRNRDFFRRRSDIVIDGEHYMAYGNLQLFSNPFKRQVIVHRRDNDDEFEDNLWRCVYVGANGGVLVSPFVSEREKMIRDEAIKNGGRIILVSNRPFGEREKPAGRYFELCAEGRMLIIAPQIAIDSSRASCLRLNALSELLAADGFGG